MIYYIDPRFGSDENDGLSPAAPKASYRELPLQPGDSVLFRRGTLIRGCLYRKPGTPEAPIVYGAYGTGENPTFCGSVDVSDPAKWTEIRRNVWKYTEHLPSEACNFIYDFGRIGATLRWDESLLCAQGDWYDSRMGSKERHADAVEEQVLLYSDGNPGEVYSHIECAVWGERNLSPNVSCTVVQDMNFFGSGVHAMGGGAHDVAIRRCTFSFIGGAVWNRQLRIRFGNAVEFWNVGENILIEDCYFNNIYDSCITQQGGSECQPAKNFVMRRNLFMNFGMGAYEGRDLMMVNAEFSDNLCLFAGGGFSAFGDTLPRNSEIYPQPMGHHLFIWRINRASEGGSFIVKNNLFHEATGAAVYAIIADEADAQMTLSGNTYFTSNNALLNKRGTRSFSTEEYRASGCEPDAVFAERNIQALTERFFLRTGCGRMGMPVFTDKLPPQVYFYGSTEKDALSYAVGEDMCFRLELKRGSETIGCPKFRCEVFGDDGRHEVSEADGASGTVELHTACSIPGYVRVLVRACDERGEQIPGYDIYEGGACADFENIAQSGEEPADFDAFWTRVIREELDPVRPVLLEQKEFHCGDPGDIVYDVKIACPGGAPVSGYLRLPRNAENGSLPIRVIPVGYGVSSAAVPTKDRSISLQLNSHGIENGREAAYYDTLRNGKLAAFGFNREENKTPDTCYFKYMILRVLQAIRYCKTLPLWDGKNITVQGGSMGAMQATSAAAWDHDVTKLIINVPWMCDLQGILHGRMRGWRPEADPGILYYDTANQAKRVTCETVITAGLGDYVCPPSGVTALYHNFRSSKTLTMLQNKTHPYTPPKTVTYKR